MLSISECGNRLVKRWAASIIDENGSPPLHMSCCLPASKKPPTYYQIQLHQRRIAVTWQQVFPSEWLLYSLCYWVEVDWGLLCETDLNRERIVRASGRIQASSWFLSTTFVVLLPVAGGGPQFLSMTTRHISLNRCCDITHSGIHRAKIILQVA